MTLALFSIISILTLLLIFFIVKYQGAQKEVNEARLVSRKTQRHANQLNSSKDVLAQTWQNALISRLHSAQKRAVLGEQDFAVLELLFCGFSDLLHGCLNESKTMEESLKAYLQDKDIVLQDVKEVVKKFPQDIRLSWSKNTAEGLIIAFTKISERIDPTQQQAKKVTGSENTEQTAEN